MNGAASERLLSDSHSQKAMSAVTIGTGAENHNMGPGEPSLGDLRLRPRRPQAHQRDSDQNADQRRRPSARAQS